MISIPNVYSEFVRFDVWGVVKESTNALVWWLWYVFVRPFVK